MDFFKQYFSEVDFEGKEEVKVHCPFHNDTIASASVNTLKSLFRCNACGEGHSELSFISKLNGIPYVESAKILHKLEETQTQQWGLVERAELWGDLDFLEEVKKLGITEETIDKLNLGLVRVNNEKFLGIPVTYNGVVLDIRRYNLLKHKKFPKLMGNKDAEIGLVFPYDLWVKDKSKTYIFEGEKDTLLAREFGLNAITLTGGASSRPNDLVISAFKDREVVVCYDNDEAGFKGRETLFRDLHKTVKSIKYIDIGEIVQEEKEDFFDAVHKYGMDAFTFTMLEEKDFDTLTEVKKPYVSIQTALDSNRIKRKLTSVVVVSAEYSDTYALPIIVEAEKLEGVMSKNDVMEVGSKRTWYFDKKRGLHQLLELVESNAKLSAITAKLKTYMGIPKDEQNINVKISQYETIYKVRVVDTNSKHIVDEDASNITLDLYTFNKLSVGAEYEVEYVILPHPDKHQKLTAVATKVEELNNESSFNLDKKLLMPLMLEGTVSDRVNKLYQSAKHHIAKHLHFGMWLMADLVFNSILDIHYIEPTWGALDVFILGDTSTGKSQVTKGLTNLYNFGHFLSLKTSTTVGLIGGSKKEGENLINTIGAIPRQHKRLVVMEEFSGADKSFIKTMTDIRTSRRVHIVRVSGELDVPCNLRMITISNPIGDERGFPKFLSTFPNGVMPIMELVQNPEDVGRYDGFFLMPHITERINPFNVKLEGEPIPKESYEHKSQWVFTRKAHNVVFAEDVESYIWEKAEKLNKEFDSNFPLFGTKAALKLARFSVALASLILNVDETFENIIVTKEIVDYITEFLRSIYNSDIFKLHEYKEEYDSYNMFTDEDVHLLQELYPKNSTVIDYLEKSSSSSLETLRASSGYDTKDFNILYSTLAKHRFIRNTGKVIIPTPKFRKSVLKIDKSYTTSTGKIEVKGLTYKIGGDV